jgi:hypothetical protein
MAHLWSHARSQAGIKMNYCDVADVKGPLQIDLAETKYDSQLADCITSASSLVDGLLKPKKLTVPAVVPQLVKDASKFFAAWMFRRFSDPTGAEAFWVEANRFLDAYIEAEFEVYVGIA